MTRPSAEEIAGKLVDGIKDSAFWPDDVKLIAAAITAEREHYEAKLEEGRKLRVTLENNQAHAVNQVLDKNARIAELEANVIRLSGLRDKWMGEASAYGSKVRDLEARLGRETEQRQMRHAAWLEVQTKLTAVAEVLAAERAESEAARVLIYLKIAKDDWDTDYLAARVATDAARAKETKP